MLLWVDKGFDNSWIIQRQLSNLTWLCLLPFSSTLNLSSYLYPSSEVLFSKPFSPYCYSSLNCLHFICVFSDLWYSEPKAAFSSTVSSCHFTVGKPFAVWFRYFPPSLWVIAWLCQCMKVVGLLARGTCLKTSSCSSDKSNKQATFWSWCAG